MAQSMLEFLKAQTCANVCAIDEEGLPYCFSCFYAFDEANAKLYFKSGPGTHHGKIMQVKHQCSGTVVPDALDPLQIKGIQFKALAKKLSLFDMAPSILYHARHPLATAIPGELWELSLQWIKFTDNTQGFGSKLLWER